jgi:hypothetical protein
MKKNPTQKSLKLKSFLATRSCPLDKKEVFLGNTNITKDWNLVKISAS